jgi:hypothetical protein
MGRHLPDVFPFQSGLKQRRALSPLFFNSASEDITYGQGNQEELELKGTHQLTVYPEDKHKYCKETNQSPCVYIMSMP